jgi:hypothetical protein
LEREDSFIHYIKCLIRKKNNLLMMIWKISIMSIKLIKLTTKYTNYK